jgi:hypothetical protein
MNYEIKPYVGVEPIKFGMPSDEVRKVLHKDVEPVDKSSSEIPTDFFPQLGIFVYYKPPGICEAVEFGGPASPTFDGQHLLGRSYSEMERWLRGLDPDVMLLDAGLRSKKFGVGLYAPSAKKEPDLPVEGVIGFEAGFYERYAPSNIH